jgi:amidohydrolase
MSILSGLGVEIAKKRPLQGKAVLLFQPAEEIEQGARDVVNHPEFEKLRPDFVFALHNIPGVKKNIILLRQGSFAAASRGMTIKLHGKTSHAAEPENGISPANAISELIRKMNALAANPDNFEELTLLTIVHIRLGELTFGTSPGEAEIMMTLRAFSNHDMRNLVDKAEKIVSDICKAENLSFEISYCEEFPATDNNSQCVDIVENAAKEAMLDIEYNKQPFRWSEDFAYYAEKYPACLFGLGAGTEQKPLHNPDYDFPDDIIETGIVVFFNIYKSLLYV